MLSSYDPIERRFATWASLHLMERSSCGSVPPYGAYLKSRAQGVGLEENQREMRIEDDLRRVLSRFKADLCMEKEEGLVEGGGAGTSFGLHAQAQVGCEIADVAKDLVIGSLALDPPEDLGCVVEGEEAECFSWGRARLWKALSMEVGCFKVFGVLEGKMLGGEEEERWGRSARYEATKTGPAYDSPYRIFHRRKHAQDEKSQSLICCDSRPQCGSRQSRCSMLNHYSLSLFSLHNQVPM
jgi:hypothetical protein